MKRCRKCQTEKTDAEFYSTVTRGRPKDSDFGYLPGNVVKSDLFSFDEMLLLGRAIRGILDRRNNPKPDGDT